MTENYIIGVDFGDRVNHACCIIAKEENGQMIIIDALVSRHNDSEVIKAKVEEYDPDYFSLNSIHQRRIQALELRNPIRNAYARNHNNNNH